MAYFKTSHIDDTNKVQAVGVETCFGKYHRKNILNLRYLRPLRVI